MALVKRPNSKFWYAQFQINNQTIVRSTRTSDRKVAERVAAKIRSEAHLEIVEGRKKPITVEEALDDYISSRVGTPNHRNLIGHKRSLLREINGSLPLTLLSSSILEDFRRSRIRQGVSPQTIKHSLNYLIAAVKMARKSGYACPDLEPPQIRVSNTRVRYLSPDEERRLLSELDPDRECSGLAQRQNRAPQCRRALQDNYDLIVLLLDTGARYGEIASLPWRQIDLQNCCINLWRQKVRNESVLFMTDRVAAILSRRSMSRDSLFVFSNRNGDARGYSSVAIRKAFRRAGLSDCTIHTLRHTHATRLIQNGLSVYEVREVLGHADIKTTMRYAHLEKATVLKKARDVIEQLNKRRYYRWIEMGVLDQMLSYLAREADVEWLMIDSTIVRAHQHAAGARKVKGGRMPRVGT